MRRRLIIGGAIALAVLVAAANAGAVAVFFYDSSRAGTIAKGVTVAGVDLGGLPRGKAEAKLRRVLLRRLERPLAVTYRAHRFRIDPRTAALALDVPGMVDRAVSASRRGTLLQRFVRDVRGRPLGERVPLQAGYSPAAVRSLVRSLARVVDHPARSATVVASASQVLVSPSRPGVAVRRAVLARALARRLLDLHGARTLPIPTRVVPPAVSTADLPRRYPAFITVNRETFSLTLWRNLKPVRRYPIAVGRAGLETPAGLYRIDDKQVDPWWHVPTSAWAGALAGRAIPPGPQDPIKARWLGFYNGAGIHGTDDIGSLGSAASHGCIRMAIPDVIQLYDLVPYGTPIYVG